MPEKLCDHFVSTLEIYTKKARLQNLESLATCGLFWQGMQELNPH